MLRVRYGSKPIEFAKGKNAIELASISDVAPILESIKAAVESRELDALLDVQTAIGRRITKAT